MDSAACHLIVDHHDLENEHQQSSEETKIFSDISIQTGDPAIKMVRFNVEHEPLHTSRKKKSKYKVTKQKYSLLKKLKSISLKKVYVIEWKQRSWVEVGGKSLFII